MHQVQLVYDFDRKKYKRTGKIVCHDVVMHRLEQVQEVSLFYAAPLHRNLLILLRSYTAHDTRVRALSGRRGTGQSPADSISLMLMIS